MSLGVLIIQAITPAEPIFQRLLQGFNPGNLHIPTTACYRRVIFAKPCIPYLLSEMGSKHIDRKMSGFACTFQLHYGAHTIVWDPYTLG